ncbi:MAG: hypothetical protein R3C56_39690 [Pirellulaceae bacterium]
MPALIRVANVYDVPPGSSTLVEADGQFLALFNVGEHSTPSTTLAPIKARR